MSTKKTGQIYLGYNLHHFTDIVEQLASRNQDHATPGNVACHLMAAPTLGIATCSLALHIGSQFNVMAALLLLCTWAIYNDISYGAVYTVFCLSTGYYQIYACENFTWSGTLLLFLVGIIIQLGVGHAYFERRPPNELEGIVKGEGTLFTILDFLCELVLGTFHFYFILALHLGFRPQLYDKVNKELIRLNRIIEQGHKKYNDSNLASSVDGSCLILPLVLLGLLAYDAHSSCQRKL